METRKVKVRKFSFKKFFKFLLFLVILGLIIYYVSKEPIRNIVIKGTNYLTDEEIIEAGGIEDYPSFLGTSSLKVEKKIKKLPLVKSVDVKKKWGYVYQIEIEEYKVLFQIRSSNEYVLSKDDFVMDIKKNVPTPVLINYVPDKTLDKMIDKFSLLDNTILEKISEIEYTPTTYDNSRFLLYMTDGNLVYITLSKTKELNKYNKIKGQLGKNKGILYLDSGNYFDIKE